MRREKFYFLIFFIFSFLFAACSTTQQTTKETEGATQTTPKKDSLYVFDQVPPTVPAKDTAKPAVQQPVETQQESLGATFYLVQIGAFTSQEAADEFAAKSKAKVNEEIKVNYNPSINLYVVQLAHRYPSHEEAEIERNILWKMPEFKDAWIVTEQK